MVMQISIQLQKLCYEEVSGINGLWIAKKTSFVVLVLSWLGLVLMLALSKIFARLPWNSDTTKKTLSSAQASTAICICFQP